MSEKMQNVEKVEYDGKTLVLRLSGKLNTLNSPAAGDRLISLRKENPKGRVILDTESLEYISSAGLRILLQLAQEENRRGNEKVVLTNVSSDLMELLEDTGLYRIFEVEKQPRDLSIDGCELVGRGANGKVFRLNEEQIVKVFREGVPLAYVRNECRLAQQSLLYGLPTALTFQVARVGNSYGLVFELLNAKSLSTTLKEDPASFEFFADQYVSIFRRLHQTEPAEKEFPSTKLIYHGYIDECAEVYTREELETLRRIVDAVPDRNTLIHGDFHANNILVVDRELTLIDMGDVSIGHPVFDFLSTAATQANLVELNPEFAAIHTGMPAEMIKRLWRYLIDHYFDERSPEDRDRIERQIRLISKLKVALAPAVAKSLEPEIMDASLADAKANFLPRANELMGTIDW